MLGHGFHFRLPAGDYRQVRFNFYQVLKVFEPSTKFRGKTSIAFFTASKGTIKTHVIYFYSTGAQPETQQADAILDQVLSPQLLKHVTLTLVTQYMTLTGTELNNWDEDPEASMCDEGGESWKYSLRVSFFFPLR
jgi:hypothetical protein